MTYIIKAYVDLPSRLYGNRVQQRHGGEGK